MAFELDEAQAAAVKMITDPTVGVGVITGGAGTGKTTTLRTAIEHLDAADRDDDPLDPTMGAEQLARYALAAPTGKAARRMIEAIDREASTIHRLLKYRPGSGFDPSYIAARVVIIDEASMVDVELAQALLERVNAANTRVFFVGDANQIPSVGPGAFFADLISSGAVPVVRLQTIHRAAASTWMVEEAPKIAAGIRPSLEASESFGKVKADDADRAAAAVVELARKAKADGVDAQVLSPQSTTVIGVNALNMRLQAALNPADPKSPLGAEWRAAAGFVLRPGDRVIQTKNDYDRDVMNGETGTVIEKTSEVVNGKKFDFLAVDFGGKRVDFDKEGARGLRLAYAISIHKSQGSQYHTAIVVCHSTHTRMLSRKLLYTAVTRAEKRAVIVGNGKGLAAALKNETTRLTELKETLGTTP